MSDCRVLTCENADGVVGKLRVSSGSGVMNGSVCRVFLGRSVCVLLWLLLGAAAWGQDGQTVADVVERAVQAAGGREKLLVLFRMEERYSSGAVPGAVEKWSRRVSVLEAPKYWWVDGRDRGSEPAKYDVWAWTLGLLRDGGTVLERQSGSEESGRATVVLRASGTVQPAMDLHFDAQTYRLVRLDWRDDIYRFSDWREHDGAGYQAKTVIWKKGASQPWFHHDVVRLERLRELPAGLVR